MTWEVRVIGNERNDLCDTINVCNRGMHYCRETIKTLVLFLVCAVFLLIWGSLNHAPFWQWAGALAGGGISYAIYRLAREIKLLREARARLCSDLLQEERLWNHREAERLHRWRGRHLR